MRELRRMFRTLKHPRASNRRHDLVEIIVIALAATLAGARPAPSSSSWAKAEKGCCGSSWS